MGYQVDFLPVGDGGKSGDAIILRFGNLFGGLNEQQIVVIDGGFKVNGEKIKEHINNYYGTNRVDLVISTHPDNDHSSGLTVVLENMEVSEFWMHQPWKHTRNKSEIFKDGRITDNSIKEKLKESLETAFGLDKIAKKKSIIIKEPFTGLANRTNELLVLGPSVEFYERQLINFRCTSTLKKGLLLEEYLEKMGYFEKVCENWKLETLDDNGETSAENNSSTIVMLSHDNNCLLFTSDAGIPALTEAANKFEEYGYNFEDLVLVQIPHHGSKRNVGPTILDKILGGQKSHDEKLRSAVVSVAKASERKHPSKKVTNAFLRRGAYVYSTSGHIFCHQKDAPSRSGWGQAKPFGFCPEFED